MISLRCVRTEDTREIRLAPRAFLSFPGCSSTVLETWPLCYEPRCWSPGRRRCSALGKGGGTETATTRCMASRPCCIFRRYRLRSRCNALWHMHPVVSMNVNTRSHQGRRAICRRSSPMIRGSGEAFKMLTASELKIKTKVIQLKQFL